MAQYCKPLRLGFLFLTLSPILSQNMASVKEIDMTMKRIRASLLRAIKKTGHTGQVPSFCTRFLPHSACFLSLPILSPCRQNMPWSETTEGMTQQMAEGLCKELPLISGTAFDTVTLLILRCRGCTVLALMSDAHSTPFTAASSQMVKWELNSESSDISNWLQTETVVEGVKFTGKVSQKPDDSAVNSTCIAARES